MLLSKHGVSRHNGQQPTGFHVGGRTRPGIADFLTAHANLGPVEVGSEPTKNHGPPSAFRIIRRYRAWPPASVAAQGQGERP